ncbi:MAG: ferredoxin family protein [Candidatus Omnitrophica bacterium]|nr:ferredoxin family protein [Candidatus Omnitrophota bacterium]
MASVITNGCTKCKKCVEICPVEAFHEDTNTLVINPEICIDCGACIPACPVSIIYAEEDLPQNLKTFKQINAEKSKTLRIVSEK